MTYLPVLQLPATYNKIASQGHTNTVNNFKCSFQIFKSHIGSAHNVLLIFFHILILMSFLPTFDFSTLLDNN